MNYLIAKWTKNWVQITRSDWAARKSGSKRRWHNIGSDCCWAQGDYGAYQDKRYKWKLLPSQVRSSSGNPIDSDRPSLKGPKTNETLFLDSAEKSRLDDPHSSIQNTTISEIMHHCKPSSSTADPIENNQPSLKESKVKFSRMGSYDIHMAKRCSVQPYRTVWRHPNPNLKLKTRLHIVHE